MICFIFLSHSLPLTTKFLFQCGRGMVLVEPRPFWWQGADLRHKLLLYLIICFPGFTIGTYSESYFHVVKQPVDGLIFQDSIFQGFGFLLSFLNENIHFVPTFGQFSICVIAAGTLVIMWPVCRPGGRATKWCHWNWDHWLGTVVVFWLFLVFSIWKYPFCYHVWPI